MMELLYQLFKHYFLLGFILIFIVVVIISIQFMRRLNKVNKWMSHFTNLFEITIDYKGNILYGNAHFMVLTNHKYKHFEELFSNAHKDIYYKLLKSLYLKENIVNFPIILTIQSNVHQLVVSAIYLRNKYKLIGYDHTKEFHLKQELIDYKIQLNNSHEEVERATSLFEQNQIKLLEQERRIWNLTYIDPITNTYNRNYLIERCKSISSLDREGAFILINIDNIEHCNQIFGPTKTDNIIIDVANNIQKIIGNNHILARVDRERFAILYLNSSINDIEEFIKSLIDQNTFKVINNEITLHLSISAGVSFFPKHGLMFDSLIKTASLALNHAKDSENGKFILYNDLMETNLIDKMAIEALIRDGLEHERFFLVYQPIYNMVTGEISGFETLIRLKDEKGKMYSPDQFIPITEETKLIIPIGYWIVKQTCLFINRLKEKNMDLTVSINVSVIQLLQDDFVDNLKAILKAYQIDPKYFEIEITETTLMTFNEMNLAKINELREFGIKIALDDFGTGYSSLLYFKKTTDIAIIKIDKEFVDDLNENKTSIEIVDAMIYLSHKFNFKVIAEGVETAEQYMILSQLGCDYMQGYLGSKPIMENLIFEGYDGLLNINSKLDRRGKNETN